MFRTLALLLAVVEVYGGVSSEWDKCEPINANGKRSIQLDGNSENANLSGILDGQFFSGAELNFTQALVEQNGILSPDEFNAALPLGAFLYDFYGMALRVVALEIINGTGKTNGTKICKMKSSTSSTSISTSASTSTSTPSTPSIPSMDCSLDGIDMASLPVFKRPCEEQWPELAPIYCYGKILEAVNYHGVLFNNDSKQFADRPLKNDPKKIVEEFNAIFGVTNWAEIKVKTMTGAQVNELKKFVRKNFGKAEGVLKQHDPEDWMENPPEFEKIKDKDLKEWAKDLNNLWKQLGRKMPDELKDSNRHSLLYVPNPFVVPGGRFREFYYWDTYWIIRGLLASGMKKSVKNICQNIASMIERFGFMPNGGRIYYSKRSQPPFFTSMVYDYYEATQDKEFLKKMLPTIEKELDFWVKNRSVPVVVKNKRIKLCQYRADSNVPRPEAWCRDTDLVKGLTDPSRKAKVWHEIASAAESGWDFSSRWIKEDTENKKNPWKLLNLRTTQIVPVDLNALICGNYRKLSELFSKIDNKGKSESYNKKYSNFRKNFIDVFESDGGTFNDYELDTKKVRKGTFYGSTVVPLFTGCLGDDKYTDRMFDGLMEIDKKLGIFKYPFGVPTSSVLNSAQQWDFPNIWPPVSHMMIEAFSRSGSKEMQDFAFDKTQQWLSANYKLYKSCENFMWMKMAAQTGTPGAKGDFHAQLGFGWTNGAVLDLLVKYGDKMKLIQKPDVNCTNVPKEPEPEVFPPE
ncbi:hypothetical protein niasHT_010220 [Heterodera trifolii]|uniref:Trehalase n=1 Tax=Heterodera trifolii TaxID=157864 RepID=A0ABD2MDN8_9BILA